MDHPALWSDEELRAKFVGLNEVAQFLMAEYLSRYWEQRFSHVQWLGTVAPLLNILNSELGVDKALPYLSAQVVDLNDEIQALAQTGCDRTKALPVMMSLTQTVGTIHTKIHLDEETFTGSTSKLRVVHHVAHATLTLLRVGIYFPVLDGIKSKLLSDYGPQGRRGRWGGREITAWVRDLSLEEFFKLLD